MGSHKRMFVVGVAKLGLDQVKVQKICVWVVGGCGCVCVVGEGVEWAEQSCLVG